MANVATVKMVVLGDLHGGVLGGVFGSPFGAAFDAILPLHCILSLAQ
jgi:hypothetical protein